MRLLTKKEVRSKVCYSPQHIARLEKAGLFPKRVQLGVNRVEEEEDQWIRDRIDDPDRS